MSIITYDFFLALIAVLLCIYYNIHVLLFSAKILPGFRKNKCWYYLFSCVNTGALLLYDLTDLPFFPVYFIGILILVLEYSFLSKASMRQKAFGASVFFFHISVIHVLVIALYSSFRNLSVIDLFENAAFYYQTWILTLSLLLVILLIVSKKLNINDIKKISDTKPYSKISTIITISIISLLALESYFLIQPSELEKYELYAIGTSAFCTLLFYYFFLYSINFVKLYMYKRKNDKIKDSHSELLSEKHKLEQEISRDSLTQLFTKSFIQKTLEVTCSLPNSKFAVLFVDINGLKKVNDTYGHEVGDVYICSVAEAIKQAMRKDDIAARIGGDEFLILLNNLTKDDVSIIISRINEYIEAQNEKVEYQVAVSIGSTYVDSEIEKKTFEQIVKEADAQMLKEKKNFYKRLEVK